MLRVAVIGAGIIVENHLNAIAQFNRMKAVAVADINGERAGEIARRYGVEAYTDYRTMLKKEKPSVAIVALPHYLHKEAAIYCANQGCHILMEKPMAMNASECEDMIEAARINRVQLMVGLTQHYFTENRKAREFVQNGVLGRIVMVNDTRHQFYFTEKRPEWFLQKEKAGGGIIMNLGAHSVDKIQWLLGTRIRKVKARLSHFGLRGDIEGSGSVFLEMENGIPATIMQSGYPGVPVNTTELIFTNGMLRLQTGKGLWISENGAYREESLEREMDPFVLQLTDLVDAINGIRPLECSGEYAATINEVLDAIYRSHETGEEIEIHTKQG